SPQFQIFLFSQSGPSRSLSFQEECHSVSDCQIRPQRMKRDALRSVKRGAKCNTQTAEEPRCPVGCSGKGGSLEVFCIPYWSDLCSLVGVRGVPYESCSPC